MPTERCEEQARLALVAVAATNRVYDAKNALDAARKRKLNTEPHELALHDAREAEWHAIAALENHKKQHKCWGIGLGNSLTLFVTQSRLYLWLDQSALSPLSILAHYRRWLVLFYSDYACLSRPPEPFTIALSNRLNPNIGRILCFTLRWSCSTMLFKY